MRRSYSVLVGLLVLLASPTRAQDPAEVFVDSVEVVESELLVELPPKVVLEGAEVLEDGAPRAITRSRPVVSAGPEAEWRLLIWIDAVLAAPDAIERALTALAVRATELTALGEVEIVLADPAPRRILLPTRDPGPLEAALLKLSGRGLGGGLASRRLSALLEARRASPTERPALALTAIESERELVRRQTDWLLLELEGGCGGGACALLWVSDGWLSRPAEPWRSDLPASEPLPSVDLEPITESVARLATVWRWLVWPLRLPATRDEDPTPRGPAGAAHLGQVGDVVLFRVRGPRRDPELPPPSEAELDAMVDLAAAPLRAIANDSAGGVIASERALDALPRRLARFHRVWYHTERSPNPRLRRLALAERGAPITAAKLPRWNRGGTLEEATELHLRRLLAGEDHPGEVEVRAVEGKGGIEVSAQLQGVDPLDLEVAPPQWRLSWQRPGEAPHHRRVRATPQGRLEATLGLRPDPSCAIVVEDLSRHARRGVVVQAAVVESGRSAPTSR